MEQYPLLYQTIIVKEKKKTKLGHLNSVLKSLTVELTFLGCTDF